MTNASIACPDCAGTCTVPAPANACVFFHECECCGAWLRPASGDCCVLCTYGVEACPPRRAEDAGEA